METVKKRERQFTSEIRRLAKSKAFPSSPWPTDPLRTEFYKGVYTDKVENAFFDCSRRLPFSEVVRGCIANAATQLAQNRRGKMMTLSIDQIERTSFERISAGVGRKVLEDMKDFDSRKRETVRAAIRTVVEAAAALYEKQFPPACISSSEVARRER